MVITIYITGDCHGDFGRFTNNKFSDQKEMTQKDYVIICGDFGGVWKDTPEEKCNLRYLSEKNFTTLFVDGNHENFDRLFGEEFEEIDFCGGKAHKIRENIFHLERGHVFDIDNVKIFAFGGARSHDISDGILEMKDYENEKELKREIKKLFKKGKRLVRVNHMTWWEQEMPTDEEMQLGLKNLEKASFKVDYIISHDCPQFVASFLSCGQFEPDEIRTYFNEVADKTNFSKWFFGHYHHNLGVLDKYEMLYDKIIRIK